MSSLVTLYFVSFLRQIEFCFSVFSVSIDRRQQIIENVSRKFHSNESITHRDIFYCNRWNFSQIDGDEWWIECKRDNLDILDGLVSPIFCFFFLFVVVLLGHCHTARNSNIDSVYFVFFSLIFFFIFGSQQARHTDIRWWLRWDTQSHTHWAHRLHW